MRASTMGDMHGVHVCLTIVRIGWQHGQLVRIEALCAVDLPPFGNYRFCSSEGHFCLRCSPSSPAPPSFDRLHHAHVNGRLAASHIEGEESASSQR